MWPLPTGLLFLRCSPHVDLFGLEWSRHHGSRQVCDLKNCAPFLVTGIVRSNTFAAEHLTEAQDGSLLVDVSKKPGAPDTETEQKPLSSLGTDLDEAWLNFKLSWKVFPLF